MRGIIPGNVPRIARDLLSYLETLPIILRLQVCPHYFTHYFIISVYQFQVDFVG